MLQFLFRVDASVFFHDTGTHQLDILFKILTSAGSEPAYILFASLIFWCFNKKTGIRAMYVIMFSAYVAIIAKNLLSMPRPPVYLHKVAEEGFGFPSGHAQVSSGIWTYLGLRSKQKRIMIAGAAMVFLVSLSRIYLGVHYPGDVIGGIIFGMAVAFIFYRGESRILMIFHEQNRIMKYLTAILLPLLLVLIASFQTSLLKEQIELGFVMGSAGAGYLLEEEKINFQNAKGVRQAAKRAFIGILFLGLIYLISGILLLINPLLIFFKYAALGFSSVFIVPWIFSYVEQTDEKNT